MSKYGVFSGPYFPTFGPNTDRYFVSLHIQSECGKIRARKNSIFGHISRSTVNQCHKEFYYGWCRGSRYASETSSYEKFKNEQLKDNVNIKLIKQFFGVQVSCEGHFPRGAIFRGAIFFGVYFRGVFSGSLFPGGIFPDGVFVTPDLLSIMKGTLILMFFSMFRYWSFTN